MDILSWMFLFTANTHILFTPGENGINYHIVPKSYNGTNTSKTQTPKIFSSIIYRNKS